MKKIILAIVIILVALFYFVLSVKPQLNHKKLNDSTGLYVAMGDSVAAGLGTGHYVDASACDRGSKAYPIIVAKKLNFTLLNLACSGAKLSSGILMPQDVNDLMLATQLSVLEKQSIQPKLITITIGANDINWTNYLSECYQNVCDTPQNTAAINQAENILTNNLNNLFSNLGQFYKRNLPKVYLTGYYQVFPLSPITSCSDMTNLSASDLDWITQELNSLNNVLKQSVVNYSFAKFIPVNFAGHELCTNNSWVQGLTDSVPFHPNSLGQMNYVKIITTTYQGH